MGDEQKKDPPETGEAEADDDDVLEGVVETETDTANLVALTGGLIHPEVVEDEEANRIRHRILEISRRVDDDKLELGALFFRVRVSALYTKWANPATGKPFQRWDEYVEQETSFSLRSISHMVAIWFWFSALNQFPRVRELIRQVGWRKASVLVGLADDHNFEQWFALANKLPREELELNAKAAMNKAGLARRPSLLQKPNPKAQLPAPPSTEGEPGSEERVDTSVRLTDTQGAPKTSVAVDGDPSDSKPVNEHPARPMGGAAEDRKGVDAPSEEDLAAYEKKKVRWSALMDEAQQKHVEAAVAATYDVLKDAGTMKERPASAEVGRGLALEMMATHALAFYSGANAVNKDLRSRIFFGDIMKGLETNFGVFVIAIDQKKGTIVHGLPDEVFEALERKLGVDIVAIKKGTNECVYGWDTATRLEEMVSSEPAAEAPGGDGAPVVGDGDGESDPAPADDEGDDE